MIDDFSTLLNTTLGVSLNWRFCRSFGSNWTQLVSLHPHPADITTTPPTCLGRAASHQPCGEQMDELLLTLRATNEHSNRSDELAIHLYLVLY